MKPSMDELKEALLMRKINLSHQRLKVLEYLSQHECHPSVEQIYSDLHQEITTLSKTTVYNTLHVLADAGLVRAITTDDNETRYDMRLENHGHFKCESCGKIYDFHVHAEGLTSSDLEHFQIRDRHVYFKGICPSCLAKIENRHKK